MADGQDIWDGWPRATIEEGRAKAVLEKCMDKRGLRSIPVPVPIEEFIEGALGYDFEVCDLSSLGEDVIGSAWCEAPFAVAVSERIENENGRFRFTAAHELGHIVMHSELGMRFDDGDKTMLIHDHGFEAQANRFASGFLMPWTAVEAEMVRICRDYDINVKKFLGALLGANSHSLWMWKHRMLPRITSRFEVSLSAAIYRFTSLKLPDGSWFLDQSMVEELMTAEFSIRRPLRGTLLASVR